MATEFLGYPVPVEYAAGLEVDSIWFTVTYDGSTYAAVPADVPFTTTADFDASKWQAIEGVTGADLSGTSGAAMVGLAQGGSVADAIRYVTPEMFGAVGDGATDDTTSLQAAVDYCLARPKITGVLGYGCYAVSNTVFLRAPGFGFSFYLRGLVTHSDFPKPETWRTATPMLDIGTGAGGAPVGLDVRCDYVDGGEKADWIGINSYGCGGSHFHASRLSNVKIGVHFDQFTYVSSSNRITGEYWYQGVQAVRAGKLDGGTSTCEGTRVNINFMTNFTYGAIHLSSGAQYAEVLGQTDFCGKYLLELALTSASFTSLARGATITNGTASGEVMAFYMWPVGTYKVLVAFDSDQKTSASFAVADTLTTDAGFSNTVSSVAKPGADNFYFDVIHDFQGFTFGKCIIRLSYSGGVVGGYLHSSIIEYYNSNYAFGLAYNGHGIAHSSTVLTEYDTYYNQPLWAHSKTGQGLSDTFSRLYNPLYMGDRRIYGVEVGLSLVSGVASTVRTFTKVGDATVPSTAEVWKVSVATTYHGVASELIIHVYSNQLTMIQLANLGGVISYAVDGMSLTAIQGAQDSMLVTFNFQRVL